MAAMTFGTPCWVKPSRATPQPHHMFLSAMDIVWRWFHYNQRILFYKLQDTGVSYGAAVGALKASLAGALEDFFPWAGRLFEQPDGRLALDCNDAGVEFVEATIDVPFSSLEEDDFQHQPFFAQLAPRGDLRKWTGPHLPLLSIQVTRFPRDEGLVLGLSHSHAIGDGSSLWHFLTSWGECGRGLPISVKPVHTRAALALENLGHPAPRLQPSESAGDDERPIVWGGRILEMVSREGLVQRNFHFSAEAMRALKAAACGGGEERSSFQALCAHAWKRVTAARGSSGDRKSGIFLIANMRSRLLPRPLPGGFFGNALTRDAAVATARELQEESLPRTAARVGALVAALDHASFASLVWKLECLPPSRIFEGLDFNMDMHQVTSSPRFTAYDVDFGWGPPACVRSPRIPGEGEIVLFPGRAGGGSVDFSIALSPRAMDALVQDEGFLGLVDGRS